jgi:L-ascorbate metabolism protein UlaG (beta-lactamase superfamily)
MMEYQGIKIYWLGHASFKIKNNLVIYIDPYLIPENTEKADLILITHEHYDHCAVENVRKLVKEDTVIVAPKDCISKFADLVIKGVTPNQMLEVKGVRIETIPAYNLKKSFHTKNSNWVGYILTICGTRIYHAGDTDFIPEMRNLSNIDIALVPVGGNYTMNAEEAAEAVNSFNPKIAIPIHYGEIIGSRSDAGRFKELTKCEVKILEKE